MSQYLILSPKHDLAVVTTAEFNRMQEVLDLLRRHVLAGMSDAPAEFSAGDALVFSPELARPRGQSDLSRLAPIDGKRFSLPANVLGAESIAFDIEGDVVRVTMHTPLGMETVRAGLSDWIIGPTGLPALPLHLASASAPECRLISGAAAVGDDGVLSMEWRFPETAHAYRLECRLLGDAPTIAVTSSISGLEPSYPTLRQMLSATPG